MESTVHWLCLRLKHEVFSLFFLVKIVAQNVWSHHEEKKGRELIEPRIINICCTWQRLSVFLNCKIQTVNEASLTLKIIRILLSNLVRYLFLSLLHAVLYVRQYLRPLAWPQRLRQLPPYSLASASVSVLNPLACVSNPTHQKAQMTLTGICHTTGPTSSLPQLHAHRTAIVGARSSAPSWAISASPRHLRARANASRSLFRPVEHILLILIARAPLRRTPRGRPLLASAVADQRQLSRLRPRSPISTIRAAWASPQRRCAGLQCRYRHSPAVAARTVSVWPTCSPLAPQRANLAQTLRLPLHIDGRLLLQNEVGMPLQRPIISCSRTIQRG